MDTNSRVALAEIRGDVKLVLAGQERTHADVQDIRKTLGEHNVRIAGLETQQSERVGERRSLTIMARILYALAGGGGVGVLALAARHFGL
jgi:hypothetical protein